MLTGTVDAMGALLLGTESNSSSEANHGGLVLLCTSLGNSVVDAFQVTISEP